jgi:hypothetical protein
MALDSGTSTILDGTTGLEDNEASIVLDNVTALQSLNEMPDEEAARKLDTRLRFIEHQSKRTFLECGMILLNVQARELWRLVIDPLSGRPYKNLTKWVEGAAPRSRRDCFSALNIVKELKDVPMEDLAEIPRCNMETLKLLSPRERTDALAADDGKAIAVIEAAKKLSQKDFAAQISRKFPQKLPNPRGERFVGKPLNFRGFLHEPLSEQGVVFLFGMVAKELGFVVQLVTTGFPDCEAMRQVGKDRFRKVKIEFEFKSRNFDHDPSGCDIVVCWEHNWPDCPLEVIELKTKIKELAEPA